MKHVQCNSTCTDHSKLNARWMTLIPVYVTDSCKTAYSSSKLRVDMNDLTGIEFQENRILERGGYKKLFKLTFQTAFQKFEKKDTLKTFFFCINC
jgi:hypothetical protein